MDFSPSDIVLACANLEELHLIVLPTEACNFRCRYCYETHTPGQMPEATVHGLLRFLDKRLPGLSHFTLDWFGGEPLLSLPIIRKVNRHVLSLVAGLSPQPWFRSGMTTNGFLLTETVFGELLDLGVNQFQVTLDGIGPVHDRTRVRVHGAPSFDVIWANLCSMRASSRDFELLLRVHLMKGALEDAPATLREIAATFGSDARFRVFLKPIRALGGPGAEFCDSACLEDGEAVVSALAAGNDSGREYWQPSPVCHAAKLNSFIVRTDGTVSKCTTALSDPLNAVGRLLPDGTLQLEREKVLRWSRGVFTGDAGELYCPLGGIRSE